MSYFRAENLSLHFGGLKAVEFVSFAVEKGEILSHHRPQRSGQEFDLQPDLADLQSDVGPDLLRGPGHHRSALVRHRKTRYCPHFPEHRTVRECERAQ